MNIEWPIFYGSRCRLKLELLTWMTGIFLLVCNLYK